MPYGNKYRYRENGNIVQWYKGHPSLPGSSVNPFTVAGAYPLHGGVNYIRSGTNTPKAVIKGKSGRPTPDGPWEWRLVKARQGPRLAYKVFSKRLNKNVWARDFVMVPRLVKTWRKPAKKKVRSDYKDLPPNALSYHSTCLAYYGDDQVVSCMQLNNPNSASIVMTGALWAPFLPFGANFVPGVNADNYTGPNISARFESFVSEADSAAVSRLYEKVKGQHTNLAQIIAERRQTASLFLELVKRLVGFWIKLRKGDITSALGKLFPGFFSAKGIANDHLAIQYGLRPLLSDMEGIVATLTNRDFVPFSVTVKKRIEVPRTVLEVFSGPSGLIYFKDEVTSFGYVEVKYKYKFAIPSETKAIKRTFASLGFGNLNALSWELTPFSFVVDWFLPIGSYLNNLDAFSQLQVVSSTKTVIRKEFIEFKRVFGGNNSGYTTSSATLGFVAERFHCDRTIISEIPALRFPTFKDPVSKMHIANAIALLVQLRK